MNSVIGEKTVDLTNDVVKKILQNILGLPNYFSKLLLIRCSGNTKAEKITKAEFLKNWKTWRELENETPHWRAFWLLSSDPKKKYITIEDFKLLFK